jgi:hypothetical protein
MKAKQKGSNRDGNRFVLLPHVVLDAPAFIGLSGSAVQLLIDMTRQFNGNNNGRILACLSVLSRRGWTSNATLTRARRELEDAGLILQTRTGTRPNRATWYALTWLALDCTPEMEIELKDYPRGLYLSPPQKRAA